MAQNQPVNRQAVNNISDVVPGEPRSTKDKPFGSYALIINVLGRGQDPALQTAVSETATMHLKLMISDNRDNLPVQTMLEDNRSRINQLNNSSANTLEKRRADQASAEQFEPLLKPLEEQYAQLEIERNKLTDLRKSILDLINESNTLFRALSDTTSYTPSAVINIQTTKMAALREPIVRKVEEYKRAYQQYRAKLAEFTPSAVRVSNIINPAKDMRERSTYAPGISTPPTPTA